jgi:hypothetical protein
MRQSAYSLLVSRQPIIDLDGGTGLFHKNRDISLPKKIQHFWAGAQNQLHAARQYDDPASSIEQLFHIGDLNARNMVRIGFRPIPWATPPGNSLKSRPPTPSTSIVPQAI